MRERLRQRRVFAVLAPAQVHGPRASSQPSASGPYEAHRRLEEAHSALQGEFARLREELHAECEEARSELRDQESAAMSLAEGAAARPSKVPASASVRDLGHQWYEERAEGSQFEAQSTDGSPRSPSGTSSNFEATIRALRQELAAESQALRGAEEQRAEAASELEDHLRSSEDQRLKRDSQLLSLALMDRRRDETLQEYACLQERVAGIACAESSAAAASARGLAGCHEMQGYCDELQELLRDAEAALLEDAGAVPPGGAEVALCGHAAAADPGRHAWSSS